MIGSSLLTHVCGQLNIEGMLFLDYPQRRPTRHEHIERLKPYLDLRSFAAVDQSTVTEFVRQQVYAGAHPEDLLGQTEEHLREKRIVLPGLTVLDKSVTTAAIRAEEDLYDQLGRRASPEVRERLLGLLIIAEGEKPTLFQRLQQIADRPSPGALFRELDHLEQSSRVDSRKRSISATCLSRWALTVSNNLIAGMLRRAKHGLGSSKIREVENWDVNLPIPGIAIDRFDIFPVRP